MSEREIRDRYETGRSDGFAQGAYDAQWHRDEIRPALAALEDELRHARDYVQIARSGYPTIGDPRRYRAYHVGWARGYRESVGIGGRT